MSFEYTDCELLEKASTTDVSQLKPEDFHDLGKFSYGLRASDSKVKANAPRYAFIDRSDDNNVPKAEQRQCVLEFDVPIDLKPTVLLYYKLTNFYQNHRRYVKSQNQNQLRGDSVSIGDIRSSDCKPLTVIGEKIIYPCGLIANSLFNGASVLLARD